MPVYRLPEQVVFPDPREADESGLLAVGGDLSPERLLAAYALGIFPWYQDPQPILWHSPDPRLVLVPGALRVSRSLQKVVRAGRFEVRLDTSFGEVIRQCAQVPRPDGPGTWITADMVEAYERLFDLGFAHCAESWRDGALVGGLYGVSLGGSFFGESMFALEDDASKVAFVALVRQLGAWSFDLVDCQVHTEHLTRFGASEWPRDRFLETLDQSLRRDPRRGRWELAGDPAASAAPDG